MQNYSVKINTELPEDDRICVSDSDIGETANGFIAFNTKLVLRKIIFLYS